MNEKIRKSINDDIEKCKVALSSHESKKLYEVLYAKYRMLDNSIDNSIPKYVHGINDTNYDHELTALMAILEIYLLCDSIPAKTEKSLQYNNGNNEIKMSFYKLSSKSEKLLNELLCASDTSRYLLNKYKISSKEEKEIIRDSLSELEDNGFISAYWADNLPVMVNLKYTAKNYHEQLAEYEQANNTANTKKRDSALYDVFISHANVDKNEYVNELKQSLDKLGINVFYDKDTLEWGDYWKKMILEGVEKAEFAIIVISENYFGREWTEKELQEFLNRQNTSGQKTILPILHNITVSQLQEQYPTVANIQALISSDYSCDEIALKFAGQLIKRLKA